MEYAKWAFYIVLLGFLLNAVRVGLLLSKGTT